MNLDEQIEYMELRQQCAHMFSERKERHVLASLRELKRLRDAADRLIYVTDKCWPEPKARAYSELVKVRALKESPDGQ